MTTENTIIIFHRSKQNAEESFANQQAFLEEYNKHFVPPVKIIDYMTGDYRQVKEMTELISKHLSSSYFVVVINSHLSMRELDEQYNMHRFLKFLKIVDKADFYLMDSEGKLYREVENIEKLKVNHEG